MVLMAVHAAGAEQADQMADATGCLEVVDKSGQRRILSQRAVGHRRVDARQILHDDTPGAQVHVPDLGIAHLALGQTHFLGRGIQARARTRGDQTVPGRCLGQGNGVVGGRFAVAPSVQDAQDDGSGVFGRFGHGALLNDKQALGC